MSPLLTIDLDAVIANYRLLQRKAPNAEAAAVVKANAYGLGVAEIAPVLYETGCRRFFVAQLKEALELRALLPDAVIYLFNGLAKDELEEGVSQYVIPVLNSPEQIENYAYLSQKSERLLPAILHIDTGMNRLGLTGEEVEAVGELSLFDVHYVMTHPACADDQAHPKNEEQRNYFNALRARFPGLKASFANSAAVFLGVDYHLDLIRPGCALYGINPLLDKKNPMKDVVSLTAPILQLRRVDRAGSVGYGATASVQKGATIATLPLGYADGYFRHLGNKASCFISGQKCPVIGRVSMDLITIDVSHIDGVKPGDHVSVIGKEYTVNDLAKDASTIGYELCTQLGARYKRSYIG